MSEKQIKQIPYGISDYEAIRRENLYYVDKTRYLKEIEKAGKYLFFIRPRRFGKSLLLSVMEGYYDLLCKDRFTELFLGTEVFEKPTAEKHTYLVFYLNFSVIDPGFKRVAESFLYYIKEQGESFLSKYSAPLDLDKSSLANEIEKINGMNSPSDILRGLINRCKRSSQKLYVIIDEYDNFTNAILAASGKDQYLDLTRGESFFRTFFNVLKGGTSGLGAPISRLFITGVSPVTLDDVTSGFNIGENISLDAAFSRMLGFTQAEVEEMIRYYRSVERIHHDTAAMMAIMTEWYGYYRFSEGDEEFLYNSDMVLYFFKEYFKTGSIPDDLIDRNVRVDYGKLKHLIITESDRIKTTNGNFGKLKEIIEEGSTTTRIVKGFPLEQLADYKNFTSLLFYLGLLTIKGPEKDKLRLGIPNETVKRLYFDYIEEAYRETNVFTLNLSKYSDLMTDMAYDGKWRPLFDYIGLQMTESINLRDFITGEKTIHAFLNVYLGLSSLYIIHREREYNKGFADLVLEPFTARYEGIKYAFMLEIKYIKESERRKHGFEEIIERQKQVAEQQLAKYSADAQLAKALAKTTLIKLALVFCGSELLSITETK